MYVESESLAEAEGCLNAVLDVEYIIPNLDVMREESDDSDEE